MENSIGFLCQNSLSKEDARFKKLLNVNTIIKRANQQDKVLELVNRLSWRFPQEIQDDAVQQFVNIAEDDDYSLLLTIGGKSTWDNAVRIIKCVGYPKNKQALPGIILLFQDLNWPGTYEGIEILKEIDKKVFFPIIEAAIEEAFKCKDYMWLGGIKQFIEDAKICKNDFNDKDMHDLLAYADW